MAKETNEQVEPTQEEKTWTIQLAIVDENNPPRKVLVNKETEETIAIEDAIAEILNNQEKLKKLLD